MLLASSRLTFDCVDPALLGHFWAAVTGYRLVVNEASLIRLQGDRLGSTSSSSARWSVGRRRPTGSSSTC